MSSQSWVDRARAVLPGATFGNFEAGVMISHGQGAHIRDTDGKEYIDYLIGSGPMILGHAHPEVNEEIHAQLSKGTTFFANNPQGVMLAEEICSAVACADQLRFVSTGGEADMYAIRLARAHTGRTRIVKFEGGYHGMSDEGQMSLMPSQMRNFPQAEPDSAGILPSVAHNTLVAPYNDLEFMESLIAEQGEDIAGIIVEPLQRIIPPMPGFLEGLRNLCTEHGIVLVFDEIVTGFRFAYGGAQEKYGVVPDICTLGKIIGGGLPLAAIAGRADLMQHFEKGKSDSWLMQIGTLNGNPLAAIAGLKTLEILRRPGQYERLEALGRTIWQSVSDALTAKGIAHQMLGEASLFDVVFTDHPVRNYRDLKGTDRALQARFQNALREGGLFKSAGKTYPCLALTDDDIAKSKDAIEKAVGTLA